MAAAAACDASRIADELRDAVDAAMREAEGAFGDADLLHRAGRRRPAPHRGADPRRRARRRRPPLRARLLGPASPPEGRRDRPRAEPRSGDPRPDLRRRRAFARSIGYTSAGTVEFLLDPQGKLRLHRDEPAHPGRAHRHRGGDRRRPGAGAAADRRRRDAGRPRRLRQDEITVRGVAMQCRITTEDPANGFRPDTGRITHVPLPRRRGRTPRRRHRATPAPRSRLLRLAARQAHLRGRTFDAAVERARACDRGVPDPRRHDQPHLPPGAAQQPRVRRGPVHHRVHRRATRSCSHAPVRRPRAPSCSRTWPT